jgi:hypothetical protein
MPTAIAQYVVSPFRLLVVALVVETTFNNYSFPPASN